MFSYIVRFSKNKENIIFKGHEKMLNKILHTFKRYSPFEYEKQEYKKHTSLVDCDQNKSWHMGNRLNLFIHGYSAIVNEASEHNIIRNINQSSTPKSLLYLWSSGSLVKHFVSTEQMLDILVGLKNTTILTVKKTEELFMHFKENQNKAEIIGASCLLQDLSKLLETHNTSYPQINLIGHSLGARMICSAIKENPDLCKRLNIHNIVFLGGAAPIQNDWEDITDCISGNIYNFYSKIDVALMFKPDMEKNLGRYEIPTHEKTKNKIHNIQVKYHHWTYWENLGDIQKTVQNIF